MFINRFQDTGQYKKELDILMRSFTWLKKVDSVIGCQGPVVVLPEPFTPAKGFS